MFLDGFDDVLGVAVEGDGSLEGVGYGLECSDDRPEFGAVVGGESEGAAYPPGAECLVLVFELEVGAVSCGSGVTEGGAIGVDDDLWLGRVVRCVHGSVLQFF